MPPDTSRQTPDAPEEMPSAELVSDAELAQMLEELDQAEAAPQRGRPLEVALVRELEPGDLIDLLPSAGGEVAEGTGSLVARIRHSHHQIARLFAEGRKVVEISALLGYSPSWLSSLKNDPAFRELLAYYAENQESILAEVFDRQKALGIAALEELQDRLESDPEAFANRELMELIETNVNKPAQRAAGFGPSGPASPPSINISFITPEPKVLPPAGPTIEGELARPEVSR